jgi:peptide/nickel transport system ATP-binding protein
MDPELISVRSLDVRFPHSSGAVHAVISASMTVRPGEIVGVAGESGSGKSTLCAAMIRALPASAIVTGSVNYRGRSLYDLPLAELRALRGQELSMVLQNPSTSLDPLFTIGNQLLEVLGSHRRPEVPATVESAIELLRRVHLTRPELRIHQFPHQLSGGMKQRVLIAMASGLLPRLLVADEPTSALDASVQEEILTLFREIRDRSGTSIVIVSHDLGAVRRVADRTVVMYAGRIVEDGPTDAVFDAPRHPYTQGLIGALPRLDDEEITMAPIPGQVPDLTVERTGCPFADRCSFSHDRCRERFPPETLVSPPHRVFCWLHAEAS